MNDLMTYEAIAKAHALDELTTKRFLRYMKARWGNPQDENIKCRVGYAGEWAKRFKAHVEYGASDSTGQAVLRLMEKVE